MMHHRGFMNTDLNFIMLSIRDEVFTIIFDYGC